MNIKSLKKKFSNEIYMMHVKSKDPKLGEIEYWKSGPKRYDVRPIGWKDNLGSVVEFQNSYILVDDPDDELYSSVEEGIHALVKKHDKRSCEAKEVDFKDVDWGMFFAGGGTPISLRKIRKIAINNTSIKN